MPQSPPESSPTRQVERIREILVGRQLNQVEQRLARLEGTLRPMPLGSGAPAPGGLDFNDSLTTLRDEIDAEKLRQMEETRRLAHQIQTISRQRREVADEARQAVVAELKPGFDRWQEGFMSYLAIRENKLRYDVEQAIGELRERVPEQRFPFEEKVRGALAKFAGAAHELCEALNPDEDA
ncbi:hypothetical protein [Haloferula sargassicola]|uniref:Uncharacterized protein n=1 Tax=Haloferula sargassicola TaxID=490096 RepID=A0ABP9UQG4_9BACT